MSPSTVALGRPIGKFDTDVNGLARYSLPIDLPKGRGHGNEPVLSFEYSQGAPNGVLGVGWAISGTSSIRLGPAALAFDGLNDAPAGFDPFVPRLALDGNVLLNIQGDYLSSEAVYRTEIDSMEQTVKVLGDGFVLKDSTGQTTEYGTTSDSRSLDSHGSPIEWRVKKRIDPFGNCVTFHYEQALESSASELQTKSAWYISAIAYTSNIKTGLEARHLVTFEYMARDDPVVQSVYGDRIVWSRILKAVHIGLAQNPTKNRIRSYQVDYVKSPTTASYISTLIEVGYQGGQEYRLDPTTFEYKSFHEPADQFHTTDSPILSLLESSNTVMAMNLNVSGRGMADLACFSYNTAARQFSIKTFLAERTGEVIGNGPAITWQASQGEGSDAQLPFIDPNCIAKAFGADLNGDGRVDLILPFEGANGTVHLSLSESIGTGFKHYQVLETNLPWNDNNSFKAVDLTGRGTSEIVQIFSDGEKLALRTYPSFQNNGESFLLAGQILHTDDNFAGTIDWLDMVTQENGARSLLRIWRETVRGGLNQLKATRYILKDANDPASGFVEASTSMLGLPVPEDNAEISVIACDINSDGVEDIITCVVEKPGNEILFKFNTFLGDGLGSFSSLGHTFEKEFKLKEPLKDGSFHLANFLGSQTPDLAYVGCETSSGDVVAFIAEGSHSGLVRDMLFVRIASNVPFSNVRVSASDLNGSGVSDFLIQAVEGGTLKVINAYNVNDPSDFMASTTSPLGMKTDITYASLSDPAVYEPDTKWDEFRYSEQASQPVLGASNLVVSKITHINDAKINAIPFGASLTKMYKGARINRLGRGWQGFSNIVTTNFFEKAEPVIVDEEFQQTFPLTGLKTKIDTMTSSGPVLKSEKTDYGQSHVQLGQWKIFRVDRLKAQSDMLDQGSVVRTTGREIIPDSHGNTLQKRDFEVQNGRLVHESWERSTYTKINGMAGLQTSRKWTSKRGNVDQSKFEDGDFSFSLFDYDSTTGNLVTTREWSSDVSTFATISIEFDGYGNEISKLDASGLKTTTVYDAKHQTFPIRVAYEGTGVSHSMLSVYDEISGLQIAQRATNGLLTCRAYDAFGRSVQSKVGSVDSAGTQQSALEFLGSTSFICHEDIITHLERVHLDPHTSLSFDRVVAKSGLPYLCAVSLVEASDGTSGRTEILEATNCTNTVCRRSSKHGEMQKSWKYWNYNFQGLLTLESFPMYLPPTVGTDEELDFVPNASLCTRITYNGINMPIEMVRPSHTGTDHFVVTKLEYFIGGAVICEKNFRREGIEDKLLSTTSKSMSLIAGEERVTNMVDENGLKSTFVFDAAAQLITCRNAGNKTETRSYNSRGQIVSLNNVHQNMHADSSSVAIRRFYNVSGCLLAETNALGETIEYEYDCMQRPLRKVGKDGRAIKYEYDANGLESLSSVTMYASPSDPTFETKTTYEYDIRGRGCTKVISFADGSSYATSVELDWQDKVIKSTLPDGATVNKRWQGGLLCTNHLVSPSSQKWDLKADVTSYSAFDKPQGYHITGTSFTRDFIHEHKFDELGFPMSHSLTAGVPLVQNHYLYGDLNQLQRVHEFGSGQTTDYLYAGKRLMSSEASNNGRMTSYTYDDSGNMISRGATKIEHGLASTSGITDQKLTFEVGYDGAGRMVSRQTPGSNLSVAYDSFGNMSMVTDVAIEQTTKFLCDDQGHTLQRTRSDGSHEIFISRGYTIIVKANGQRSIRYSLSDKDDLLATITKDQKSESVPVPGSPSVSVYYTDTKKNVTHVFNADDRNLGTTATAKLRYDDYGLFLPDQEKPEQETHLNTYEGRPMEGISGLLDFGSRWYDPLVGRFTTPDDITDPSLLVAQDGLNRHAFENNDPVNHVDPSGHWSLNATLGVLAGVALIGLGFAVVAFTGGAAAPLVAVIAKAALVAGGIAGISYSFENSNEMDKGKFWKGWGMTVAVNAAVGAVTCGIGEFVGAVSGYSASMQRLATSTRWAIDSYKYKWSLVAVRVLGNALMSGVSSVLTKAAGRAIGNEFLGQKNDVWGHVKSDFWKGFATGFILGAGNEVMGKYGDRVSEVAKADWQRFKDPSFSNVYSKPGVWDDIFANSTKTFSSGGGGGVPWTQITYKNPFTQ
ncbi:hypothetical protein FVEN_g6875 [Fusarium venenatum]|uniref:uncharacterized protein n=1 Tax=Fusarium venenatum TaxID=56646 RepID=UPI001DC16202|nr:hypothetical protein FVEN_g6875 [Fusarium venenatum]KAH7006473.1 hypothetical protein EDB82DRAFT_573224 [Fusarium venenatum]